MEEGQEGVRNALHWLTVVTGYALPMVRFVVCPASVQPQLEAHTFTHPGRYSTYGKAAVLLARTRIPLHRLMASCIMHNDQTPAHYPAHMNFPICDVFFSGQLSCSPTSGGLELPRYCLI